MMREFAAKLCLAAAELQQHHALLRESARTRLGSLFDPTDFPDDLELEFHVDWEFVSVEVPSYLRELNESLYRKERERVDKRFEVAAKLIEESLTSRAEELIPPTAMVNSGAGILLTPVPAFCGSSSTLMKVPRFMDEHLDFSLKNAVLLSVTAPFHQMCGRTHFACPSPTNKRYCS